MTNISLIIGNDTGGTLNCHLDLYVKYKMYYLECNGFRKYIIILSIKCHWPFFFFTCCPPTPDVKDKGEK